MKIKLNTTYRLRNGWYGIVALVDANSMRGKVSQTEADLLDSRRISKCSMCRWRPNGTAFDGDSAWDFEAAK